MEKKSSVKAKWTAGVEDPQELEKRLMEQTDLFLRLYTLLEEKEKVNYEANLKKSNYEKEAWSAYIADSLGYGRALSEIKSLLSFTQNEE